MLTTHFSRRQFLLASSLLPFGGAEAQLIGNRDGEWSIRGTDPIEVFYGERRTTTYQSGPDLPFPRFDPIVGPGGTRFTVSPDENGGGPDGPGASGVAFTLANVNGHTFRKPAATTDLGNPLKAGIIHHRGMNGVIMERGASSLTLRLKSEWTGTDEPVRRICSDRREIALSLPSENVLLLDARIELTADAGDLEIGPQSEGAWSVSLAPGLVWTPDTKTVALRNGSGQTGDKVPGAPSPWIDCQGKDAGGSPAGVAILDHPANPGAPATWIVSANGLLAANPFPKNGDTPPRILPNGESLVFRYRTVFYRADSDPVDIAGLYEDFAGR